MRLHPHGATDEHQHSPNRNPQSHSVHPDGNPDPDGNVIQHGDRLCDRHQDTDRLGFSVRNSHLDRTDANADGDVIQHNDRLGFGVRTTHLDRTDANADGDVIQHNDRHRDSLTYRHINSHPDTHDRDRDDRERPRRRLHRGMDD